MPICFPCPCVPHICMLFMLKSPHDPPSCPMECDKNMLNLFIYFKLICQWLFAWCHNNCIVFFWSRCFHHLLGNTHVCNVQWFTTCTDNKGWLCKPWWMQACDISRELECTYTMSTWHIAMHTCVKWHTLHSNLDFPGSSPPTWSGEGMDPFHSLLLQTPTFQRR